MFSYRTLAVSVLPREAHSGEGPVAALDLPPEVGHRNAGNVARAFFGEDFCDDPTCLSDTCFDDTCPDPTCFEDTCLHHSCHHQTCPDATADPPPPPTFDCCDCDSVRSCQAPSCDGDSCPDGQSGSPGSECDDFSNCFCTLDCGDATCMEDTSCLNTIEVVKAPPDIARQDELAQLHRELDGLQADTTG
jgi:hypothetical protein